MVGEMEGQRDQERQIQRERERKRERGGKTTKDDMPEREMKRCDRRRAKG